MSDNNSQSWTDPITGEVYPSVNPHISIQRSTPFKTVEPDLQPQRDVMPTPQQPRPQFAPPPTPQPTRPQAVPRPVQPVPRPVQSAQSNITRFCDQCGGVIGAGMTVCPFCGGQADAIEPAEAVPLRKTDNTSVLDSIFEPRVVINNTVINNVTQNITPQTSGKKAVNKWVAFVLCFFFGNFGIHRFYEGKIGTGILYLCTFGLFGIGAFVDMIRILCKPNPYYV